MKKIILFAFAAIFTLSVFAQKTEVQMATLQHGNQTSVFYGTSAFVSAYNAAADTLDVITLSSGVFDVPSYISKSVSVYGAGYQTDEETGAGATILNGSLSFKPVDIINDYGETVKGGQGVNGIHLEGLNVSGSIYVKNNNNVPIHDLTIVKCYVGSNICFEVNSYNTAIRQCKVDIIYASNPDKWTAQNMLIENSHIVRCDSFLYPSTIQINHCILTHKSTSSIYHGPYYYTNNILYKDLPSTATAYNNIFVSVASVGTNVFGENNWVNIANEGVYAADGEDGSWGESKDYMIKYPLKFVGNDGTVVGLHGGNYPWNKVPCIPRIVSGEIDTQTSAEGKLRISIQAEAQAAE